MSARECGACRNRALILGSLVPAPGLLKIWQRCFSVTAGTPGTTSDLNILGSRTNISQQLRPRVQTALLASGGGHVCSAPNTGKSLILDAAVACLKLLIPRVREGEQ